MEEIITNWNYTLGMHHPTGFKVRGVYYLDRCYATTIATMLVEHNPIYALGFSGDKKKAISVIAAMVEQHYCELGCRDLFVAIDDATEEILGIVTTANKESRFWRGLIHLAGRSLSLESMVGWMQDDVSDVKDEKENNMVITNIVTSSDPRAWHVAHAMIEAITEYAFATGITRIELHLPVKREVGVILSRAFADNKFNRLLVRAEGFQPGIVINAAHTARTTNRHHFNLPKPDKNSATPPPSRRIMPPLNKGKVVHTGHAKTDLRLHRRRFFHVIAFIYFFLVFRFFFFPNNGRKAP